MHTETPPADTAMTCDRIAALVSSVMLILTSSLACIIGFICGRHFSQSHKQLESGLPQPVPIICEESIYSEPQEVLKDYELNKNVAYCAVQSLAN